MEYRAGFRKYKIMLWLAAAFFLFCAIMAWRADQRGAALCFVAFLPFVIYSLVSYSHIIISDKMTRVVALFSEYQMTWLDVKRLEVGPQGTLVFYSRDNNRLVAPSLNLWSGQQSRPARDFLSEQLTLFETPIRRSAWADYKIHKGVKLK
ncbi:MAG: hypothetical protein HWE13_01950 [Gammaproteobacteria bacterium]|nr:hypothetical protein [Gammaproteobacteria bacterium]